MCRALRVLCAGPSAERLTEMKRAAVATHWELVGGASSVDQVAGQVEEWRPDVVVLDAALGEEAVDRARAARPSVRILVIDAGSSLDGLRGAILGLPPPGGPVRT